MDLRKLHLRFKFKSDISIEKLKSVCDVVELAENATYSIHHVIALEHPIHVLTSNWPLNKCATYMLKFTFSTDLFEPNVWDASEIWIRMVSLNITSKLEYHKFLVINTN